MKIVLVRHGDPDYEKDCLTELGHKQAAVAAQRLLKEDIDEIYTSPHGRARQTAAYFSEASGIKQVTVLDFIREIRFGTEEALYDNRWNPWLGVDALIKEGKDLQSPAWREYPVFKDNLAVSEDKFIITHTPDFSQNPMKIKGNPNQAELEKLFSDNYSIVEIDPEHSINYIG